MSRTHAALNGRTNALLTGPLTLRTEIERWPLLAPFRITDHTWESLDVLLVTLEIDSHVGRGEAAGVYYKNDHPATMIRQIESVRTRIEAGISRDALLRILPATVNIKLDKCGGLTAALEVAKMARDLGLNLMVGNMLGTSLAMAPAFLVGQLCEVVDLDGPLFLRGDRATTVSYNDGYISCPAGIWG